MIQVMHFVSCLQAFYLTPLRGISSKYQDNLIFPFSITILVRPSA